MTLDDMAAALRKANPDNKPMALGFMAKRGLIRRHHQKYQNVLYVWCAP